MALVNDLHHMTFLTADMDRLISFYQRIFDARVTLDSEEAASAMRSSRSGRTRSCTHSRFQASGCLAVRRSSSAGASTTSR